MRPIFSYLIRLGFLKTLGIAAGIFLGIFLVLVVFLKGYTQHNKSIAVPDLTDMSLEEVEAELTERKLRFIIFDSLYANEKPPHVVIDQHPQPGRLIKKNRKIFLTMNAHGPEKIQMEQLVGQTLRVARARLSSMGLRMGRLSYKYDITKNVVLEQKLNNQELEPGTMISKGTSIDLVLSKGLSHETSMVPSLIGLSVEDAQEKASNTFFSLNEPIPDLTFDEGPDSIPGFIFRQRPVSDPKIRVPLGSAIDIYITRDSTKLPGYTDPDSSDFSYTDYIDDEG